MIAIDRRLSARIEPAQTTWRKVAFLRPAHEVLVINLSAGGALVSSPSRLYPGVRTEMHLFGTARVQVPARVARCRVVCLNPLRYEGAIVFDRGLATLR